MTILSRIRWLYAQRSLGGLVAAAARNPTDVTSLFTPPDDDFYDIELPVYREDVLTILRPLVDAQDETILEVWRELEDDELASSIEASLAKTSERPAELHSNWRELLYTLVRLEEPDLVLETGVFDGLSSAYILHAVERNGTGQLVSVDINDRSRLPRDVADVTAGWVVPTALTDRWDCQFGDARELLPKIVEDETVDVFLHDSLHTADHMRFEFETVERSMPPGALFVSDNVRVNDVFWEFARDHLETPVFWKNTTVVETPDGTEIDDRLGVGRIATEESERSG